MWSFLFENLEIPKLLTWILSSTGKDSKVFISSSSKLVSLTCSVRSAKLDVLVCIYLVICMGLQKCLFFLVFLSEESLFRDAFNGWKPNSHWRRASQAELSSSFNLFSVWENHRSPFLLRSWALGTGIENALDYVYRVVFKSIRLSLLCVSFNGNIIIILPFITILIKSYWDNCDAKNSFSLAIIDFTRNS